MLSDIYKPAQNLNENAEAHHMARAINALSLEGEPPGPLPSDDLRDLVTGRIAGAIVVVFTNVRVRGFRLCVVVEQCG